MKSPIGNNYYCEQYAMKKVNKLRKTIDIIADNLTDYPLMALQLLEFCAGFPRIGYTLNTTPINTIQDAIETHALRYQKNRQLQHFAKRMV